MIDVDHDDIILRTFILFVQTAHAALKYGDAHFYRALGLSVTKFIVLQALALNGGTMTPSEIAQWTFRERHNITTLVHRLSRDGLVRAKRNNRDKRFVDVILTDKGRQVYAQALPVSREIVDRVMSSISQSDAAQLEKPLRAMRQNAHDGLEEIAKR